MIITSILYDLVAAKTWSSKSFIGDTPSEDFIQKIVEHYFSLLQEERYHDGITSSLDKRGFCLHIISDNILLIGITRDEEVTGSDVERISKLAMVFGIVVQNEGAREASKSFTSYSSRTLREDVLIHFISDPTPASNNKTGIALTRLLGYLSAKGQEITMPVAIGPYNVRVSCISIGDVVEGNFSISANEADAVVLILGSPLPEEVIINELIQNIRFENIDQILIVPGSDDELEIAREYEANLNLILCDSVSSEPSYLLLNLLAMIGKADALPEQTSKTWDIDSELDLYRVEGIEVRKDEILGHQAFFVVNKFTGDAIFTYYYQSKAKVHERVPNVVAAITSFSIGISEDAQTSVVQVGDLVYALIEFENLIFTLITGEKDDVEGIRLQFSFLPDLWKDEAITELESTEDPYSAPPFTLKLLATLPPEEFLARMQPSRLEPPDWERFKSRQVRDFLQAVWSSLDGSLEMSRLVSGSGPQMTLGAIHFLKAMGCIKMNVTIRKEDVPILVSPVDDEIRKLYSHIGQITSLMYDNRTLDDISKETGIEFSVLNTVILELYNRGIIKFQE